MFRILNRIFNHRIRSMVLKELRQMRRDRRMVFSLIFPPTLQLILFGFALSNNVANIRLGIVDDNRTPQSRELVAVLSESRSFRASGDYLSVDELSSALSRGDLEAGVVIPFDLSRNLERGRPTTIQFLLNAENANTAAIAQGYAEGVLQSYNFDRSARSIRPNFQPIATLDVSHRGLVQLSPTYFYNPGLAPSWFIVTGIFGMLMILNGSIVASAAMVKERERGTIEQLLMSPASTSEIIFAKIVPLFVPLYVMAFGAVTTMKFVFGIPFHGHLALVMSGAALCILSGISLGTVVATFSKSAKQAQLTAFFVNPPLNTLSGATSPIEALPRIMQKLTVFNPISHWVIIVRASLLKGSGIGSLWPHFLALLVFAAALASLSIWHFRKQLN
jgi:ABC-2 type transport system permease protein